MANTKGSEKPEGTGCNSKTDADAGNGSTDGNGKGSVLMVKAKDFFVPVDFSYRALSEVVIDPVYLGKRLPPEQAGLVLALLEMPEPETGVSWELLWNNIMCLTTALNDFSATGDDFGDIGFAFRTIGGIGDNIHTSGDHVCSAEIGSKPSYLPADPKGMLINAEAEHPMIRVEGKSNYYHENMDWLRGKMGQSERRERLIAYFEECYLDTRRKLFEDFERLGVHFDIEQEDPVVRSLYARQRVNRHADPIYVIAERMVSESATNASMKVQRYNMNPLVARQLGIISS